MNVCFLEVTTADIDQVVIEACEAWRAAKDWTTAFDEVRVRAYRQHDPEPRPAIAEHALTLGTSLAIPGPHELAIVLNFEAGSTAPRRRGRLYIGSYDFRALADRPPETLRYDVVALGNALAELGGAGASWVQYSPTTGEHHPVTRFWVTNRWAAMRRRGLPVTHLISVPV